MFFIGFAQDVINKIINNSIFENVIGSLVLIIIATIIYNVFTRISINRPFKVMKEQLLETAAGSFNTEIPEKYLQRKDEFGEIALAIKEMQNSLKNMIVNVREKAHGVNTYSEELAESSVEMTEAFLRTSSVPQRMLVTWSIIS